MSGTTGLLTLIKKLYTLWGYCVSNLYIFGLHSLMLNYLYRVAPINLLINEPDHILQCELFDQESLCIFELPL